MGLQNKSKYIPQPDKNRKLSDILTKLVTIKKKQVALKYDDKSLAETINAYQIMYNISMNKLNELLDKSSPSPKKTRRNTSWKKQFGYKLKEEKEKQWRRYSLDPFNH